MIILNAISFIIDARGSRHAKQTNWLIMAAIQHGIAQAGTMKPITRKGHKERARRQNQGAIKVKVQHNLKSKVMETNVTHSIFITQIRINGVQRHPPVSVLCKVQDNASTRTNVMWGRPASSTTGTIMV